jgi:hypothetical protein
MVLVYFTFKRLYLKNYQTVSLIAGPLLAGLLYSTIAGLIKAADQADGIDCKGERSRELGGVTEQPESEPRMRVRGVRSIP